MKFLNFGNKKNNKTLEVAEKQLRKNRAIIESLRDYDTGKKDISIREVERRVADLRTAPQK